MQSRRKARENAFFLIFGGDYSRELQPNLIYEAALESARMGADEYTIDDDDYTRDVFFGVSEHLSEIDGYIERHSRDWKINRISGVSRAIIRLSIYEMLYRFDVPANVSINEAIELVKKFDEESARVFVNGVLNAAYTEIKNSRTASETEK